MKDVATYAGVSPATVSRVLSDPDMVSKAVVTRVRQAIEALDYAPNAAAGNLRRRDTGMILVLLPDIGNGFFSKLLHGIETKAREANLSILIGDTGLENANLGNFRHKLQQQQVDGMILLNGRLPDMPGVTNATKKLPIVAASELINNASLSSVQIDNIDAARLAVRHLQALGHRRIAHIAGPPGNVLTLPRRQGYELQMQEAGSSRQHVAHGDFTIQSGRSAARALMKGRGAKPTAFFAANDSMAIGAIVELRAQGFSVPEDISIIGFDDIEISEFYSPSLTTIAQPRFEMGQCAMTLLEERLRSPESPDRRIILPTTLVQRGSTLAINGLA